MAWQPPADSVVHGSVRRLDPARVSRGYAIGLGVATLLIGCATWSVHTARTAATESRIETLQRDAARAPWVVGAFLVALCLAGTTKRCFGFGREGALGIVLGFGAAALVARTTVPIVSVFAGVAAVLAFSITRTRWRRVAPWIAFAFGASAAVALASAGVAPLRWSPTAERTIALGIATAGVCVGAAVGLWTCRWNPRR